MDTLVLLLYILNFGQEEEIRGPQTHLSFLDSFNDSLAVHMSAMWSLALLPHIANFDGRLVKYTVRIESFFFKYDLFR